MLFSPRALAVALSLAGLSALLLSPTVSVARDRDGFAFEGGPREQGERKRIGRGRRDDGREVPRGRFQEGFETDPTFSGRTRASGDRRLVRRSPGTVQRGRGLYLRQGSVMRLRDEAGSFDTRSYRRGEIRRSRSRKGDSSLAFDPSFVGFDEGDGRSSFVTYIDPFAAARPLEDDGTGGGPRIIDVDAERLDRRPIGASGIDVVHTGGAKIIRIAPDYNLAPDEDRGRAADVAEARTPLASDRHLQPWSSGWLKYCTRTYQSFDPDLGTYVGTDAKIRFCSAE